MTGPNAPDRLGRMSPPVDPGTSALIHVLAAEGWTRKEFSDNHLEHAANLSLEWGPQPLRSPFLPYWRTAATISSILQSEGIAHVLIKTRRSYPYSDTNVDVYLDDDDAESGQRALSAASWRIPSRAVRLKQRLIEREKLKLPPRAPGLVPAHLYMSVSWRYQREVSFLEPDMVETIPLTGEAPGLEDEFGDLMIPVPTRAADMLLHGAEIVFENYRISLGEILYFKWLIENVTDQDRSRVLKLAADRGAEVAVRTVLGRARAEVWAAPTEVLTDWPRNLTVGELRQSWGERFRKQAGRGRVVAGLEEWIGYATFGTLYGIKRTWFD